MKVRLLNDVKEYVGEFFKSRLIILIVVVLLLFSFIVNRLFSLQIVRGEEYMNDFELQTKKEQVLKGTRGKIFDRNGKLLAYNELAYSITIADTGSYNTIKEKNSIVNPQINQLIQIIEGKGDSLVNDFSIAVDGNGEFYFTVEGNSRKLFLGTAYGKATKDLTEEMLNATAKEVFEYLCSKEKYGLDNMDLSVDYMLKILRIRMDMSGNNYQKYITTTVAEDVSQETVAMVMEHADEIQGVSVEEVTMRRYNESIYFAPIIGYTGKISPDELEELKKEDKSYDSNDIIGKAGIENYMEKELQGKKGSRTLYVNNVGKILEIADVKDSSVGNDVYLTIDSELQKAVYQIIEQKLAGILVSKIRNVKEYTPSPTSKADDIIIPIDDVYFALFNNNIINIDNLGRADATNVEKSVDAVYQSKRSGVAAAVISELRNPAAAAYKDLSDEMKNYMSRVAAILSENDILVSSNVDKANEVYQSWRSETTSLGVYIREAIAKNWIDVSKISVEGEYTNSDETYEAVLSFIEGAIADDYELNKSMFKYLIANNQISGKQVCLLLYAQGVLAPDEGTCNALLAGNIGGYDFMMAKISSLEITPAQLALDPCSGSCTITDPNTGEVLAMVTYPSYDNNRLANSVDAAYYNKLINDLSKPLYNRATQEKSAPGSTFKMVTAIAGLTEGVITPHTTITDKVEFKEVVPSPKCWSRSGHGSINVSQALEHSCNYFFYDTGYSLSKLNGSFNEETGISKLQTYAKMFGLNEKSGVEITESAPSMADEYPITAAIGQSNHNYASIQLARYVTAISNSGTVYNLSLLDKLTDSEGNVIADYSPAVFNKITLPNSTWNSVHTGMNLVAKRTDSLKKLNLNIAGKTGTAQENKLRPNHALFVGYAPFENPQIALAVKIANGYTSANSAEIASEVFTYYFKLDGWDTMLNGTASRPDSATIED